MTLDQLLESLPTYADDLKRNFMVVVREQSDLTQQQAWGTVVASAMASRNQQLMAAVFDEGAAHLTPEALRAAKASAAIMGMNNIFYRFLHFASNEKYRAMRAGLRMNIVRNHGIAPLDFELWELAVSTINGCDACVDAHEKALREKGLGEEKVLAAVRIAAVLHGLAVSLDAEKLGVAQPAAAG